MGMSKKKSNKVAGEPMVWFTAMGLSLGILMITGLLALIAYRGLEVFWPKRVAEITIQPATGTQEKLLGEIVLKRDKKIQENGRNREWQLFLGNRDILGQAFRFIDEKDIQSVEFPQEAVVVERLEFGDAIGFPVEQKADALLLRLADGSEQEISHKQILRSYYPNQLNTGRRLALFFRNIGAFLSEDPREANTEGGVFPAIFGTFVMTVLMSLAVVPFGVLGAIYLHEYAKPGILLRLVRIAVNNLAGVPSIVFGVFGLGFFVYLVGGTLDSLFFSEKLPTPTFGTGGVLWASLTLALMTVPVVIVSTEEALGAVSREIREGAMACGASKWQAVKNILLPASAPGILTGAILAMARGAGEVAPLMIVGVVKMAPTLPLNGTFPYIHLDQKFMHLGFHIFDLGFQSPDSEAAKPMVFATTLLLIALVLVLNLGAIILRERLRKKYASGTF